VSLYLLTPPTSEFVTLDDAKAALRLDDDRFDALLPGLIASARQVAEQECARGFVEQTWRAELADWPLATDVLAVYRPTACAISYWNTSSAWATLSTSDYVYAANGAGTVLAPALTATGWPTLGTVAVGPRVRIDLTTGVESSAVDTVPECVRTYICALVGQMLQTPELSATQAAQAHPLLARLLDSQRIFAA